MSLLSFSSDGRSLHTVGADEQKLCWLIGKDKLLSNVEKKMFSIGITALWNAWNWKLWLALTADIFLTFVLT